MFLLDVGCLQSVDFGSFGRERYFYSMCDTVDILKLEFVSGLLPLLIFL